MNDLIARAHDLARRVSPHARMVATIANELAGALPGKDSTGLQKLAGFVSAADKVNSVISGGRDPAVEYVQRHGLVHERSEPFVSLFFDSDMSENFATKKSELTKYEEGIEAVGPSGRLFFLVSSSDAKPRSRFYHSKSFDVQGAVDTVWEARSGRLGAEVMALEWGESKTSYYTYPESTAQMFGDAPRRLAWLIDLPKEAERKAILESYFKAPLRPPQADIDRVVAATEGLSQDYLREFAQLMERVPLDEVLASIAMKHELLAAAAAAAPESAPGQLLMGVVTQ